MILSVINSADPDQIWSGSSLFAISSTLDYCNVELLFFNILK